MSELRSVYFCGLVGDVQIRYLQKIQVINGVDPYTLTNQDININIQAVPVVSTMDLVNYLILSHSFYTGVQLKAHKSLKAYKYYEAGFVGSVICKKIGEACVVVAKVKHSQRMRERCLDTWVIVLADGSISSGHCTCMAGQGEVCSHVSAILFLLHARTISLEDDSLALSCTDKLAVWPVPSTSSVSMVRVKDMQWGKRPLTQQEGYKGTSCLKGDTLIAFLHKVKAVGCDPVIGRVIEPFASEMQRKEPVVNLLLALAELYNANVQGYSLEELKEVCSTIPITCTLEEAAAVEEITRSQSLSSNWFKFRAGRITASKFKYVCRTSIEAPSLSLLRGICYPEKVLFHSKQTSYGVRHEKEALHQYEDIMRQQHVNFEIKTMGLIISEEHPQLGVSLDGMVTCECCGVGCVEIKCPFTLKNHDTTIEDFAKIKSSCLLWLNESCTLGKKHLYYYQIQLQMFVAKVTYADLVIWANNKQVFIERHLLDVDFCEPKVNKALHFHKSVVLPELLGRYFTKQLGLQQLWCICKKRDDGMPMIQCENDECSIQWYHLHCVNLNSVPDILWFCELCCTV